MDLHSAIGTREAAVILNVSQRMVIVLIEKGKVEGVRTAAGWLLDAASVYDFSKNYHPRRGRGN